MLVLVIATFDYRFFKVYAGFIYAATVLLLAVLQVPGMASPTGAYIDIPGATLLQLSPAEFSKLGLLVVLASMLSELRTHRPELRDVLRACLIAGVSIGLVFINSEIGTVIVLVSITVGMLVVAGTRARHLAALAVVALVLIFLAFQSGLIQDYQKATAHRVPGPREQRRGPAVQPRAVADRDRLRRPDGPWVPRRHPDQPRLRARAAHRLHLHGRG